MKCCFENSTVDTSKTEDEFMPILTDQHMQQIYSMNATRLHINVDRYLYLKKISDNNIILLLKIHEEGYNMYSENAEKRIKEYMKKI
jgi:hypothetical protein